MIVQLLIETKILFLFKHNQIFAHPQRITHSSVNPIVVRDLIHNQSFLEVHHKMLKMFIRYKTARMNAIY